MRRGPCALAGILAALDGDIGPRRLNIAHTAPDHRTTLADTSLITAPNHNGGQQRLTGI